MFTLFIINNNNNFTATYSKSYFSDHGTLSTVGVIILHTDIITPLPFCKIINVSNL
jgi:hypothetical protein